MTCGNEHCIAVHECHHTNGRFIHQCDSCGINGWSGQLRMHHCYLPGYAGYSIVWFDKLRLIIQSNIANPVLTVPMGCKPNSNIYDSKEWLHAHKIIQL